MKGPNLMEALLKAQGTKPMVKPPMAPVAKPMAKVAKAPKVAQRPSGQFAGQREVAGKVNGGGHAAPNHPQNHSEFEKL